MNIPTKTHQGKCYIVATPIGNLEDITHRAIRILSEVNLIFAEDTRVSAKLLQHYGIHNKLVSLHEHNEAEKLVPILAKINKGQDVAIISDAGTPLISDPGYRIVSGLKAENITVIPVPGASALIAALSAAGLPTDSFYFGGFLPAKSEARKKTLQKIDAIGVTVIFYESVHRIEAMLKDVSQVVENNRLVAVCREMTKQYESILLKPLDELLALLAKGELPQKGEFVVIIQPKTKQENQELSQSAIDIVGLLGAELPAKQAAKLAHQITGEKKNALYEWLVRHKD